MKKVTDFIRFVIQKPGWFIFTLGGWVLLIVFRFIPLFQSDSDNVGSASDIVTAAAAVIALSLSFAQFARSSDADKIDANIDVMSYEQFNYICGCLEYWQIQPVCKYPDAMRDIQLDNLLAVLVQYNIPNGIMETVAVYLSKDDILKLHEFYGMCLVVGPCKRMLPDTDYVHLKTSKCVKRANKSGICSGGADVAD